MNFKLLFIPSIPSSLLSVLLFFLLPPSSPSSLSLSFSLSFPFYSISDNLLKNLPQSFLLLGYLSERQYSQYSVKSSEVASGYFQFLVSSWTIAPPGALKHTHSSFIRWEACCQRPFKAAKYLGSDLILRYFGGREL